MDWINLAQDSDKKQACMNIVRNLQHPQNVGNLFTVFVVAQFLEPQPLS